MELDDLKYSKQDNLGSSTGTALLSEDAMKKIATQQSTGLLDTIDRNLKKNIKFRSLSILVGIGIIIYYYDSRFWAYYFILGALVEAGMSYIAYKLRRDIHQNYEADLPLHDRIKQIQTQIQAYLKFSEIARISTYLILVIALSLRNLESFSQASIFDTTILFRFLGYGALFYFIHSYYFKKFAQPHRDMLVDLHYYVVELEETSKEDTKDKQ
jgi:hypothetical protein